MVAFPIPLTVGGILGILVQALLAFVVILIVDALMTRELQVKRVLIMALVALFAVPLIISNIGLSLPWYMIAYILPLIVWIILSEILLKGDLKTKFLIAVVAFAVFIAVDFIGVAGMIQGLLPV